MAISFQLCKLSRSIYFRRHSRPIHPGLLDLYSSGQDDLVLRNIFIRAYSSDSSSNSEDKSVKLSFGRRFLNALKLLASGSKLMISDAKKMFSLKREAKKSGFHLLSGKAPPPEDVTLTRAELNFIIQVNT